MTVAPSIVRAFAFAARVCSATTTVFAQSQGQVTRGNAIIWRTDVPIVATVVPLGTILTITRDLGEWYEVVIPEQTGLAFNDGDDIDLAAQLGRLLTDVPLRERLTDEGARRARVTVEPSAAAGRFHALDQDVLAESSR